MRAVSASAAKGRLGTLSNNATHQQEIADNFIRVAGEHCAPVFDVLAALSQGMRDECTYTFPALNNALEDLQTSAMGVSRMLEELTVTKEDRVTANCNLRCQITKFRDDIAERKFSITQVTGMA